MDFKIIWADSAITDLKEICDYISRDDPSAAQSTGRSILDHVKILEMLGAIREIVFGNYRIFYEVTKQPKTVRVLRIWHGARGEPNLK